MGVPFPLFSLRPRGSEVPDCQSLNYSLGVDPLKPIWEKGRILLSENKPTTNKQLTKSTYGKDNDGEGGGGPLVDSIEAKV